MTSIAKTPRRKRHPQRSYRATKGQVCAFCRVELNPGEWIVKGRTKEPYHPGCRRLSKMTGRAAPVKIDSPIRLEVVHQPCATCGQDTDGNDPTRLGTRYHRECLV